jgi:hypothetical protein
MGNRRIGRKRLESALKQLNATTADTTGDRAGKTGFHMPAFELQPSKYFGFFDDFLFSPASLVDNADAALTDDVGDAAGGNIWRTNIDGSSDAIALDNSVTGGVVNITHGTGDNEATFMSALNHVFKFDTTSATARELWWECRLKTSDISGTGFFIGLASAGGAEETDADGADIEDGCGFYVADGAASTDLTLLTSAGDAETATSLSSAVADATYLTLSYHFDGSAVHAYVNGTKKASVARGGTGFPDGTVLFPYINVAAREGAANIISVDYIRVCMER